jgi:nucleotide-binding universal stress UspA family protein
MLQFKKILCPVDFDENSPLALGLACELAQKRKATLYVLYVVEIPPGPEVAVPFDKMEGQARKKLEEMARQKINEKAPYEVRVTSGDPSVEILRAAERIGSDLIVMSTHGRKGLRRFVLGSVAERVVREASCPVLTIRPRATRAKASLPTKPGNKHLK